MHRQSTLAILRFAVSFGTGYDPGMTKTLVLYVVAFWLFTSSPRCIAQDVLAVIRLSADEAAKASQVVQGLKSVQDRDTRARISWQGLHQGYQAAHPELPNVRFSSDFRVAFGVKRSDSRVDEAALVELSAEERQKAESLHREMLEAKEALTQAEKNWRDYQNELVADHIPSTGGGSVVIFSSGKSVTIPSPWDSGLAFTADFRVAVPRRY